MPPRKKPVEVVTCQECKMGSPVYIPCGRPAVHMIGWKGRTDPPLPMCEMCADHNVRNRNGCVVEGKLRSVKIAMPAQSEILSAVAKMDMGPAPIGHNNPPVSDNDLIAENFALEDAIAAATAKFNEWAKPKKARIAEIENEIQRRLIERGADSTRTDAGTAYISHLMSSKVEDNGSLFDWVADHWADAGGEAKINIKLETVKNYMEANNGHPPPGMSVSYYSRLNIKRS